MRRLFLSVCAVLACFEFASFASTSVAGLQDSIRNAQTGQVNSQKLSMKSQGGFCFATLNPEVPIYYLRNGVVGLPRLKDVASHCDAVVLEVNLGEVTLLFLCGSHFLSVTYVYICCVYLTISFNASSNMNEEDV